MKRDGRWRYISPETLSAALTASWGIKAAAAKLSVTPFQLERRCDTPELYTAYRACAQRGIAFRGCKPKRRVNKIRMDNIERLALELKAAMRIAKIQTLTLHLEEP